MCAIKTTCATISPKSPTEIANISDLIVIDVWGPAQTIAIGGEHYFITFTDGKSRHTIIYFMKKKDEALTQFKLYKNFVASQTGHKLKKLRADGGKEYVGKQFQNFIIESGIELEITAAHSPSQNGIAKCLNQTVVEHADNSAKYSTLSLDRSNQLCKSNQNRSPAQVLEK